MYKNYHKIWIDWLVAHWLDNCIVVCSNLIYRKIWWRIWVVKNWRWVLRI